ncbi:hypothetical protein Atai01_36780 [Amycolatopsis taiwanensis]|uniref:Uncharacterized protein n=1 Tax=Amycolatopsis taiwanensis TaxID=342230 RepID=A0A9W6VHD6_9PSEU|nr:hypothetical protein Atai01_36780 [Amycolatopsis taiwanensis]
MSPPQASQFPAQARKFSPRECEFPGWDAEFPVGGKHIDFPAHSTTALNHLAEVWAGSR